MKYLLVVVFLLSGCASQPSILTGSGVEMPAPAQWQKLCNDRPELEICKPEVAK